MSRCRRIRIAIAWGCLAAFLILFLTRWHSASRSTTVLASGFWTDPSGRETYYVADQIGYTFAVPRGFTRTVWIETIWKNAARGADNTVVSRSRANELVEVWSVSGEARAPGVAMPTTPGIEAGRRAVLALGSVASLGIIIASVTLCVYNLVRSRSGVPGRCASCGYDLAGLRSRICPECGDRASSKSSTGAT